MCSAQRSRTSLAVLREVRARLRMTLLLSSPGVRGGRGGREARDAPGAK
eukprot:CAMPEP_0115148218 /NCGR_PEP_ID=MMETSP0227-20121206/63743_1 /TAXON_ID=89957 /ORGANISM="Polarella glacialis, Strain CCMP 1383" /LENGTH=48 /DNA_ID= /DNA_START= /DNA_END= /DNA_ORIENTATION=